MHELLFNGEVVIGDRENSNPIFELLRVIHAFLEFLLQIIVLLVLSLLTPSWQVVHQKSRLHDDDGLVGVEHCVVVPPQLRKHCTHVQVSVSLRGCRLVLLFNLESFLEVDQGSAELV